MHVLPHALHFRLPVVAAPLVAAGVAAIWLGSAPSITDPVRPASRAAPPSAAVAPVGTVPHRHVEQQAEFVPDGRQRFLRAILLYGMGGRPMGFFK